MVKMKVVDGVRYRPDDAPKNNDEAPQHKAVTEPEPAKKAPRKKAAAKQQSDEEASDD